MAAKEPNPQVVTLYGRLSFPTWIHAEAVQRNLKSEHPNPDPTKVAPDFNLLLEAPQRDKFMAHVKDVFLPYCIAQSKAGEKRNALTEAEANRILKVLDSDWTEQPPYISVKPVPEKTAPLTPEGVAMIKVVGPRGADVELKAIVNDESELAVPDPDMIFPPAKVLPIGKTIHTMYPGCRVAATLNLYSFISGKTPGFSSSATVAVFREDADRFGGGVELNEDELFED